MGVCGGVAKLCSDLSALCPALFACWDRPAAYLKQRYVIPNNETQSPLAAALVWEGHVRCPDKLLHTENQWHSFERAYKAYKLGSLP